MSVSEQGNEAVGAGTYYMVCWTKCWPCMFGHHRKRPTWHTWADADDVEHARAAGQTDPSQRRCGCHCAGTDERPTPAPKES